MSKPPFNMTSKERVFGILKRWLNLFENSARL
jgi:hypothetical protein